jgi:phosphoglycolate phosphatase-like HAD superfamily hydrolase
MLFEEKIELIILDFDGVIVESNDTKDKAFDAIFSRYPVQYKKALQYHRTNVSLSRYAKFDHLLELMGEPGNTELKNKLLADFSANTLEIMRTVAFVKGAMDFLQTMHERIPLYLASVTPIEDLEIILDNLRIRSYFKDVYGCPPWTKPLAVKDILEKECISPGKTVLIGDSYGDQNAAGETGIRFIGRNSGLQFNDPQPRIIVEDLTGLSAAFIN